MRIAQVIDAQLPALRYGGTERVVWSLTRALAEAGHSVVLVAREGSQSDHAEVVFHDSVRPLDEQLPDTVDIVHFHGQVHQTSRPFLVTQHGSVTGRPHAQSVFVSRRHAANHGSETWVHNGLDWSAYPPPSLDRKRVHCHFLGKAAWRVKNLRGAIAVARRADLTLHVLGGRRISLSMGLKVTLDRHARFHGMVDDGEKADVVSASRGLVFPVTWHEPFGLAVIESLYYGSPVFGTPYGALPELVTPEVGLLDASSASLAEGLARWRDFEAEACHRRARDQFNAQRMARDYLAVYGRVLDGETLNPVLPEVRDRFRDLPWD